MTPSGPESNSRRGQRLLAAMMSSQRKGLWVQNGVAKG